MEPSPPTSLTDSFCSSPGGFPPGGYDGPLFPSSSYNRLEALTPDYSNEENDDMESNESRSGSVAETPAPETKPVKKRKSWGQELPEPTTNLPPRKRAKTEAEKEQRRVERVLRNRKAAQSSRERKRQEVEKLEAEKKSVEMHNIDLERRLQTLQNECLQLREALSRYQNNSTAFGQLPVDTSSHYTPSPTLSQPLFGGQRQESQGGAIENSHNALQTSIKAESPEAGQTVNPASLSPSLNPSSANEPFMASSSDLTQHPAAMLCDLQCQSEEQRPWMYPDERQSGPIVDRNEFGFDGISDVDFTHSGVFDGGRLFDDFCVPFESQNEAPDLQSQVQASATTAGQQLSFGASLDGCDGEGNAVNV